LDGVNIPDGYSKNILNNHTVFVGSSQLKKSTENWERTNCYGDYLYI